MKKLTLHTRIHYLKCKSFGLGFLYSITRNRLFFDKKIRTGIVLISLINLLVACQNGQKEGENIQNDSNNIPIETCYITTPDLHELPASHTMKASALPKDYFVKMKITPALLENNNIAIKYIQDSIRYPISFIENGIDGNASVQFSIDDYGSIQSIKIRQRIWNDFDHEMIRVLNNLSRWIPRLDKISSRKTKYTLHISVKLQQETK